MVRLGRASFEFFVPPFSRLRSHASSFEHLDPQIHFDWWRTLRSNPLQHPGQHSLLALQLDDHRADLPHPFMEQLDAGFSTRQQQAPDAFQTQPRFTEMADGKVPIVEDEVRPPLKQSATDSIGNSRARKLFCMDKTPLVWQTRKARSFACAQEVARTPECVCDCDCEED